MQGVQNVRSEVSTLEEAVFTLEEADSLCLMARGPSQRRPGQGLWRPETSKLVSDEFGFELNSCGKGSVPVLKGKTLAADFDVEAIASVTDCVCEGFMIAGTNERVPAGEQDDSSWETCVLICSIRPWEIELKTLGAVADALYAAELGGGVSHIILSYLPSYSTHVRMLVLDGTPLSMIDTLLDEHYSRPARCPTDLEARAKRRRVAL